MRLFCGPPKAPDFDLAPLQTLRNDFLKSDDPAKVDANSLILVLACIFNDLKGQMWFAEQHGKWKPSDGSISGYNGQLTAMGGHILRMSLSIIHELMDVLRDSTTALAHPDIERAIGSLEPGQREFWNQLLDISQRRNTGAAVRNPEMANILTLVRNNTTFHFDRGYISAQYNGWLDAATQNPTEANINAFVSLGKNAEQTRFFFADAVIEHSVMNEFENRRLNLDSVKPIVRAVNNALRFVIGNYLFPQAT